MYNMLEVGKRYQIMQWWVRLCSKKTLTNLCCSRSWTKIVFWCGKCLQVLHELWKVAIQLYCLKCNLWIPWEMRSKSFQLFKSRDPSRVYWSPTSWMFDLCNFMDFSLPMTCPLSLHHSVWETFELNQLKSAPSQLLPVFQDLTGCKLVAIHLDRPISYICFLSAS